MLIGLSSNEPFITILKEHNLDFILVCKETDHQYLADWIKNTADEDKITLQTNDDIIIRAYEYIEKVPLNDSKHKCLVNVVRLCETIKGNTTKWMWVTNLSLAKEELAIFVKANYLMLRYQVHNGRNQLNSLQ